MIVTVAAYVVSAVPTAKKAAARLAAHAWIQLSGRFDRAEVPLAIASPLFQTAT